jgi:hypothetical protein
MIAFAAGLVVGVVLGAVGLVVLIYAKIGGLL